MDFYKCLKKVVFIGNNLLYYRDLKPANILFKKDQLKISDFGLAKNCLKISKIMSSIVGTPAYMSPQILNG